MNAVKRGLRVLTAAALALSLGACVTMPAGPSVMVLPPPGKPFDLFQAEDFACRQWAHQQIGMSPQDVANQNAANSGVVGAIVGATTGAALGAASGDAGEGAVIGAGAGMLLGAASGAEAGAVYGGEAQRRYDMAYQQCMYAKGNLLPGMRRRVWGAIPPPPPGTAYPPPPGRQPPPPPPGQPPPPR
ncbi:MAG TPA: YMGG-like glycine zipper-containing protein [bacterium]